MKKQPESLSGWEILTICIYTGLILVAIYGYHAECKGVASNTYAACTK